MKKIIHILIALAFLLALVPAAASAHTADDPDKVELLAGQTKDIGDVLVWNDAHDLHVKFVATSVCLEETHLHVATSPEGIPQTKKGNPIPGKFDYSDSDGCVYEKESVIPLDAWTPGTELYIAAHASTGTTYTMNFASAPGNAVYGPIYTAPDISTDWGTAGSAVRAYNWLGYTRNLSDPDQIPGCTINPNSSLQWSWGFGLNPNYSPDIPGATWISTAPNTEVWNLDSWRRFVKSFNVPGDPILATLTVNADNYYVVSNDTVIGSDSDIFNGPETYTFGVNSGANTLEFVTENFAQGSPSNYCDQLGNPNGLTYKATIQYAGNSETAWGDGEGFPGANWAMYFTYIVQSQGPTVTPGYSDLTEAAGVRYRGNSSGNEIYLGIPDLGVGGNRVEASYPNVYANWQDGTYAVTFGFDQTENKVTTTIDGPGGAGSLEYDFDDLLSPGCPTANWNTMDINVVDRLTTGELAFNNVMLNGFSLGNFDDEGWKNWTVSGFDFSQSFTVSGDMVVQGWTGSETNKLQIIVGCLP